MAGSFYTYELYDEKGREIYTLSEAVRAAEQQFGADWNCVYNGQEAVSREEAPKELLVCDD